MKLRNIYLALKYQLPLKRMLKNILNRNILGLFYRWSHYNKAGTEKICYSTFEKALKACSAMEKKTGNVFNAYKCLYCDGFHIGKKFVL
jgi:hypothetical protein